MKRFLILIGISLSLFIVSAILHNLISGIFNFEEPVFFLIAVVVCPIGFLVGIIGSLTMLIKKIMVK